jgi:hypothetical protein
MEDLKSQFKDFVIPSAPSLLYERQNSPPTKKKSSSKLVGFSINIAAFVERSKSTTRLTPVATASKRR